MLHGTPSRAARRVLPASATIATFATIAALALVCGCGDKSPTSPGIHSLSGRVRLVGYLVDQNSVFAGTRVVEDADGVQVELWFGPTVVARTLTVGGAYRFTGLTPGAYRVRAAVVGEVADETVDLTVSNADITAGYTLELRSKGNILPLPNPFVDYVRFFYDVTDPQMVDMQIRDLQGRVVRVLLHQDVTPGEYVATWSANDQNGDRLTGPYYWVTYEAGADKRAHLLFH